MLPQLQGRSVHGHLAATHCLRHLETKSMEVALQKGANKITKLYTNDVQTKHEYNIL